MEPKKGKIAKPDGEPSKEVPPDEWIEVRGKRFPVSGTGIMRWMGIVTLALYAMEDKEVDRVLKHGHLVFHSSDRNTSVRMFDDDREGTQKLS
jgi:hypothetical protein